MAKVKSIFQGGLKVAVPFLFTLFLLYWLFVGVEQFLRWFLLLFIDKSLYFTGLGLISAVVFTFFIGLIVHISVVQKAVDQLRNAILKLPLIKTFYNTASDLTSLFAKEGIKEGEVVIIETGIGKLIGIVTQDHPDTLPGGIGSEDEIAVYVQMSYNMGGYTFIVPKDSVKPVDVSVQDAITLTMTACVTGNKKK